MLLIEQVDNALQLIALVVCGLLTVFRSISTRNRIWVLLYMFYIVVTLGNLYWLLYLLLYKETPFYSYIPDFCWAAAYLSLLLLLQHIKDKERSRKDRKVLYLIPVFTFGMALFYMQWGKYLTNIIDAVLMSLLLYYSIGGLLTVEKKTGRYYLYLATWFFCLVEYGLWTSSCFEWGSFLDPYYIFDVMLTLAYVLFYPAARKAVQDELH